MNDLLKLASKALKPFGYHIRKFGAPNILRLPGLEGEDSIKALRKAAESGFLPADSSLDHFVVYVRTCVRGNRNADTSKRMGNQSLEDSTLCCLRSLVTAVNAAADLGKMDVICLDDRSDEAAQEKVRDVLSGLICPWEMRETSKTGQGPSLHQQFAEGREKNAILYFVEDDYLHEPDAIATLWTFYRDVAERLGTHSLLYPQEHEVLYKDHYPSYILAGRDRHWRTMRHATHTFVTHGQVVRKYWNYFENTKFVGVKKKRKLGSEARTTNKLFKHIPGFSPLKPAAVHFQFEHLLPPFYEWEELWKRNAA